MFSLLTARHDAGTIITELLSLRADIHPPLHFLLLKGWVGLVGQSLIALRMMNILLDLLTGTFVMGLAARSFGRRGGLIAGVLWVAAPPLIFAGYLIRMYTLLAFCTAGGAYCVSRLRIRAVWTIGAAAFALAAIY